MNPPKFGKNDDSPEKRHFDESDTWGERWQNFEDMFSDFDPVPLGMEGVWMESDLRQKKLDQLRKLLEDGVDDSPFSDDLKILKGLKESLGFFSYAQMQELQRLVAKVDEGIAERLDLEEFEKSSKTEERD
jgi:hypothetical protein